jgi:hypothetical protein
MPRTRAADGPRSWPGPIILTTGAPTPSEVPPSLDGSFGQGGSIRIDFGSTGGVTTDGARSIMLRTPASGASYDILVGGYTLEAGKFKIALVDMLDDHFFHVT